MFFYFFFFFIFLFFYHILFLFLCFCTFIWLQRDLRGNWTNLIFLFLFDSNLFSILSIKNNYFLSINIHYLIPSIFLLLVQFHLFVVINFIFLTEHIFHKIILNIFDHRHIMFLYRVFSVFYTGYMLVIKIMEEWGFKSWFPYKWE